MSRHQLVHRETVGPSNEPLYELRRVGAAPPATATFTPIGAHRTLPAMKWLGEVS